ncbi:unnamed protein product [Polarella glacialis]|uniref:Uncharacterized protein n=1 Tax=Polarella glacialis TaxID=89957 RepID=A0A813K9N2_POLGL|nr:unnamed protein product [Polarella glacialis]
MATDTPYGDFTMRGRLINIYPGVARQSEWSLNAFLAALYFEEAAAEKKDVAARIGTPSATAVSKKSWADMHLEIWPGIPIPDSEHAAFTNSTHRTDERQKLQKGAAMSTHDKFAIIGLVRSGKERFLTAAITAVRGKAAPKRGLDTWRYAMFEMVRYLVRSKVELGGEKQYHIQYDGSSICKVPTDLVHFYCPWLNLGAYSPPLVSSADSITARSDGAEGLMLDSEPPAEKKNKRRSRCEAVLAIIRKMNTAMMMTLNKGLDVLIPNTRLVPGGSQSVWPLDPPTVKALDNEATQHKACHVLEFNVGLRLHTEGESCHPDWNDVKNSIVRAGLQVSLLKGTIMANTDFGPFKGGKTKLTKQEACEQFVAGLSTEDYQEYMEDIARDRALPLDDEGVPASPEEWLESRTVDKRGIFVKYKSWFNAVVAMHWLTWDWTIASVVLDYALKDPDEEPELARPVVAADGEGSQSSDSEEPVTKAGLYKKYQNLKNTMGMSAHFYHDRFLQADLRMIVEATLPLRLQFEDMLQAAKGQVTTLHWAAQRSSGLYFAGVKAVIHTLHDREVLDRLGLSLHVPGQHPDEEEAWVQEELATLARYRKLVVELASARCWSNAHFTICQPHTFVQVHHPDASRRPRVLNQTKKVWAAILMMEDVVLKHVAVSAGVFKAAKRCLNDVAWNCSQVARETYAVCLQAAWSHTDEQLREQSFAIFARPHNTKFFLEDAFGNLADVGKRASKGM